MEYTVISKSYGGGLVRPALDLKSLGGVLRPGSIPGSGTSSIGDLFPLLLYTLWPEISHKKNCFPPWR